GGQAREGPNPGEGLGQAPDRRPLSGGDAHHAARGLTQQAGLALLAGVRILAFTQFLLGPAACQYLADMGADVIKIEPPGRGAWERSWSGADTFIGGVSAFFMLANRNLRSVTLNLKSQRGVEVARRMVETADVIVENFRPGVMDRLGLGYEDVRKINPRIIYAAGSGY